MEYIDRKESRIQRAIREEREQEDWNEVHKQLSAVQKKSLAISEPGDADEKEADEVAKKVMSGESAEIHGSGGTINRKGEGSFETTPEFQSKLEGSKGGGQSLDDSTKGEMESKMGADFSGVKIHTGNEANTMSESINAKAFTHGQDIYFNQNHSPANKELLAHELVHTVQQSEGKVQPKIQRHEAEGHQSSERHGLSQAGFSSSEISITYFGNWMRDMNQAIVPAMQNKLGLKPNVTFALISYLAFQKFGRTMTPEQFGYYIPDEHIDNPAGLMADNPGYNGDYYGGLPEMPVWAQTFKDRFNTTGFTKTPFYLSTQQAMNKPANDPMIKGKDIYQPDQSGVMGYIRRTNIHVEKRLEAAFKKGRTPEGMLHFGAALHAVEDLFAHSNFVEIALDKMLFKSEFLPQLQGADRIVQTLAPLNEKGQRVLVTGTFTSDDTFVSIASPLVHSFREGLTLAKKTKTEQQMDEAITAQLLDVFDIEIEGNKALQDKIKDKLEDVGLGYLADLLGKGKLKTADVYRLLIKIRNILVPLLKKIPGVQQIIDAIDAFVLKVKMIVNAQLKKIADLLEAYKLQLNISSTSLLSKQKKNTEIIQHRGDFSNILVQALHDVLPVPLTPNPGKDVRTAEVNNADLAQTPEYVIAGPSHSQIAKDHPESIFQGLAFHLTVEAVRRLGQKMKAAWGNAPQVKDPDFDLITVPDAQLTADQKEKKLMARKRMNKEIENKNMGTAILKQGHDPNVEFDSKKIEKMRNESAEKIKQVGVLLWMAMSRPSAIETLLPYLQKYLKSDQDNNYTYIISLFNAAVNTFQPLLPDQQLEQQLGTIAKSLVHISDKVKNEEVTTPGETVFSKREKTAAQLDKEVSAFAKWAGNCLHEKSSKYGKVPFKFYALCYAILTRELANISPAFTSEQINILDKDHTIKQEKYYAAKYNQVKVDKYSQPLRSVDIDLPSTKNQPAALQALLNESRLLINHPDSNKWWEPIVTKYAEQFGPSLSAEIKAKNAGYTKMPTKKSE
jgi:hypothetical protein